MTREEMNKALGREVEKSFKTHFSKDHNVVKSEDEYDKEEKYDFLLDGLKTQVKGVTPFYIQDSWTIKEGVTGQNLDTIKSCDKFYILSLPGKFPSEYDGYWLEVDKSKCEIKVIDGEFNRERRKSFVIPRRSDCVKKVCKITKKEEEEIMQYATSNFRKQYK